jgi:hypothetical protein
VTPKYAITVLSIWCRSESPSIKRAQLLDAVEASFTRNEASQSSCGWPQSSDSTIVVPEAMSATAGEALAAATSPVKRRGRKPHGGGGAGRTRQTVSSAHAENDGSRTVGYWSKEILESRMHNSPEKHAALLLSKVRAHEVEVPSRFRTKY